MAYDPHTGNYYAEGLPAGYDAWKTRLPYEDEPYEPEPECTCEDFEEIDPVNMRVQCCQCGRIWTRTLADIEADNVRAAEFERQARREQRRMLWRRRLRHMIAFRRWLLSSTLDFRLRLMAQIWRVKWARRWTRRFDLMMCDEEVPF